MIKVKSAEFNIEFIVENVYWGTPGNQISAQPGDVNVPLTVVIRNHSNETLRGVIGYLYLDEFFTDYNTGGNVSKATAQPVEAGDVFNQTGDILPSGSFTFTFYLNINENATKGAYTYNLTIHYNVKADSIFIKGDPKTIEVTIRIHNRAPVIYSTTPSTGTVTVSVGEDILFKCTANDPDNDSLTFEWIFDGETVHYGPNYTYVAKEEDIGTHTLELDVSDGNLTTTATWTINVVRNSITDIWVSTQYIYGGYRTPMRVNITNNLWDGTVTVNIGVTQYLVILGNDSWTFYNVSPNDTLSLYFELYAPETLIGQTMQITITISYNDEYGNTYTESNPIGLIVRGKVTLRIYDLIVSPYEAKPGDKISITGTILNVGNVRAAFTNASILTSEILDLTFESSVYIGDVDPNSPVPFTLEAYVRPTVQNGTYTINIIIQYADDLYEDHQIVLSLVFKVVLSTQNSESDHEKPSGWEEFMATQGVYIITALIGIIGIGILYYRKRKRE